VPIGQGAIGKHKLQGRLTPNILYTQDWAWHTEHGEDLSVLLLSAGQRYRIGGTASGPLSLVLNGSGHTPSVKNLNDLLSAPARSRPAGPHTESQFNAIELRSSLY
jgi:hypothetical protein